MDPDRRQPQLLKPPAWLLLLGAILACGEVQRGAMVAHTWDVMGTTLSLAAWGRDTAALNAAAARVVDSVRRTDSIRPPSDSLRTALPGSPIWADVAGGYALDRAALALSGVVDSALLDLGGQYLWVGPPTKRAVGIAHPDNNLVALAHVELHSGSVTTLTGEHRSITVLAPDAVGAAAWATLFFPLGCDSALALGSGIGRAQLNLICADSTGVRWTPATPGVVLAK